MQTARRFCSSVFSIPGLMNPVLVLLPMPGRSLFSSRTPPPPQCSALERGQPHGTLCTGRPQGGVPVPSLVQAKCSPCRRGRVLLQGLTRSPFCVLSPSSILKPLTMPSIQISEVDAPPEGGQTPSPTGARGGKGPVSGSTV